MIPADILTGLIGFIITLLVLSYLIGDNPLFRAAVYIFVGMAAGYALAVAIHNVIWPLLIQPLWTGTVFQNTWQAVLLFIPLIFSALLLTKASARLPNIGQIPVAFLAGVSAAVAIGGAVIGTIFPQMIATMNGFNVQMALQRNINPALMILNGGLVLLGVIGVLAYFHFGAKKEDNTGAKRNIFIQILTWVGQVYIAITFGVLFAGVYTAALTALIERMDSIRQFFSTFLGQPF